MIPDEFKHLHRGDRVTVTMKHHQFASQSFTLEMEFVKRFNKRFTFVIATGRITLDFAVPAGADALIVAVKGTSHPKRSPTLNSDELPGSR